jgi:uncharacterized protein YjbI with pentapeptide repeats
MGIVATGLAAMLWFLILETVPSTQVQVFAGLMLLLVGTLAVRISRIDQRNARDDAHLHAAQQVQGAIKLLANDSVVARGGGFHVLGMIWRDWPDEHHRILACVQAWLQKNAVPDGTDATDSRKASRPEMDVKAAMMELLGRPSRPETDPIDLAGCALSDHDLRGARLPAAKLAKTQLNRVQFAEAWLTGADLSGAELVGADLSNAQLAGADLRSARLDGANLAGADLSGANLTGVQLSKTKLAGAKFTGAELRMAGMAYCDLHEVIGLTASQIKVAQIDKNTRLPEGIDHDEVAVAMERRRPY